MNRHPCSRRRIRRTTTLLTLLLYCLPLAAAQQRYHFEAVGGGEGLSQNTVTSLLQDPEGFLWIGTQGGLHRYDGYRFRHFGYENPDPHRLPDTYVTALAADDEGRLWIGTVGSYVLSLQRSSGWLQQHGEPGSLGTAAGGDRVTALHHQPGVGLWVGTGAGVELLDPDSGARELRHRLDSAAQPGPRIWAITGHAGRVAVATDSGLLLLSTDGRVEVAIDGTRVLSLATGPDDQLYAGSEEGLLRLQDATLQRIWPTEGPAPAVRSIAMNPDGRLWLSLRGSGLALLDPATLDVQFVSHATDLRSSLPEPGIGALLVDRTGLLWVGGDTRGLARTRATGTPFTRIHDPDPIVDPVASNNLRSLLQMADGSLWLGTEGAGLVHYSLTEDRFDSYLAELRAAQPLALQASPMRIRGLVDAGDGTLWVATQHNLLRLDPASRAARAVELGDLGAGGPLESPLRTLSRSADGSLWIGTYARGLLRYDPRDGRTRWMSQADGRGSSAAQPVVNVQYEDRSGRLWVGTTEGLARHDANGAVTEYRTVPGDDASLSSNIVRSLLQDASGTLWVGTHNGLNALTPDAFADGRFQRYGRPEGLEDLTVYALLADVRGRIWMSGNAGITRFDPERGQFRRFDLGDGLQDLEFNGGAQATLNDGRLAFGGVRGLNVFDPLLDDAEAFDAPVVITAVRVGANGGEQPALLPPDRIEIGQDTRLLRISFAALDFAAPARNRYSYRLEPFDQEWVDAGTRNDATYTNLDAGSYRFRVRGGNPFGQWSEREATLAVEVLPPWWRSLPAIGAYVLIAMLMGLLAQQLLRRRREEEGRLLDQLREREERLKLSLWGSGDEFWDWDVRSNTLFRLGSEQLLGKGSEDLLSTDDFRSRSVHPEDLPRLQRTLQRHIVGETRYFESEHRVRTSSGTWVWVRARGKVVARDGDGNPLRIAGTARDISAIRDAERDRRIASEVLRSMSEAVAVCDLALHFVSVNPAFSRITGYSESEVVGLPSSILDSAQHEPEFYRRLRSDLETSGNWKGEVWQRRKDGEEFLGWVEIAEVRDGEDQRSHFVAVVADITDKKRAEQELRYLANYDTLTGLPNRTLLSERLARAVIRARRQETRVAVLFLDLDRFKDINDSLGHAAGDRILKSAAARLLATVRDRDTVARLGGDEFTVVLEDLRERQTAEDVAEKILAAFAQPLDVDGRTEVIITPSLGISLYPDHALVPTDLLKYADTAMYAAKERGRNTFQFYTEAMDAEARRRANLVACLRRALERGEFRLNFQPRLSLLDGRICSVEALLRWRSEELGDMDPAEFVPVAEETGLILPIGAWVLREAFGVLQSWRDAGLVEVGMSINVSVLQLLRGHLVGQIRELLDEHRIPPSMIELEVTESMVMANAAQATSVLLELKGLGVSLAIDDFGTGYSSLVYLKRLPIDTLKIDKEFVGDLTIDPDDEAITATVITMAHSLGLNVVAEGVETAEQLLYLHEQGCDEIQGFWLSPALPDADCMRFVSEHRPDLRSRTLMQLPG